MRLNIKKDGFTLVEAIIYLGIFSLIFTVIVQFSLITAENGRISLTRKELGELILLVNASLKESFANASSIDLANTTLSSDNGQITLNLNPSGNIRYTIQNSRIQVTRSSVSNDISTADFACNRFRVSSILNETLTIGAIIEITCVSVKFPQVNSEFRSNYLIS
jgi:type II secretory pathway component PulJ